MSSSSSRSSFRSTSSSRYSHKKQQRRRNQKKEDQDAGYFEHQIDMQIKEGQFVITRFLEDDTFGRVLEVRTCNTTNNKNYYVMKVKLFGFKHAYWLQKGIIKISQN
ncbi:unnamed protein product [Paramecium sonneborni]|uniref:Uncharacterized protein n=1 Tax=Paramecium sonneborni TaxID=65129 RepID=A0A8S1PM15_9CILI|nr:unnamed protein product [Paramecium sonneborni]